jgi:hypothetical protein
VISCLLFPILENRHYLHLNATVIDREQEGEIQMKRIWISIGLGLLTPFIAICGREGYNAFRSMQNQ